MRFPRSVERLEKVQDSASRRNLKLGTVTYNIAKDWDVPTLIANLADCASSRVSKRSPLRE